MSYKYKAMRQLKHLIDTGQVAGDTDIKKIFKLANETLNRPKPKNYHTNLPEYYQRAQTMNSRAKSKGDDHRVTYQELQAIMKQYNSQCKLCHTREHLVFDHVVPFFNGGTNTVDNLQVLCRICNMRKGVN